MFKLLRFVKPYRLYALLAPLLMMLEVAMQLLQPRFMGRIIDEGIAKGDLGIVWRTCLLMLGTTVVAVFGGVGCMVFSTLTGQGVGADLRENLFGRVLGLSFAETDRFTAASLITRLTQDVNTVQHFLIMLLRMLVRQPLMCIGGCVMALMIDLRLAIILIVMLPPIGGLAYLGFRIGRPLFAAIQKRMDSLNTVLQETLAGIRLVKAFHRRDYEERRFDEVNRALAEQHVTVSKYMSALMPFTMFMMNLGILGVLWLGGLYVRSGEMTVGEVMAMISYISQILFSFMGVAFVLNDFARAKVSSDRINEVLESASSVADTGNAGHAVTVGSSLEFRDVCFNYSGATGTPVIQGLSFRLKPGEHAAVMGATGSGKSTLAHLIPRFYDVSSGSILVDGRDVREYPLATLREHMAIVLQEAVLFSGTISDNIRWGDEKATDAQVREAAVIAQADGFISRFQDGYDTVVGQRGVTLSGGQKQRIAIARAIIRKPSLLILDDCASALDVATEKALHEALRRSLGGTTVLMIAQRISSVKNADFIMILSDGRCAAGGTHEELLKESRIYREIVASQTGEDMDEGGADG